MCAGQLLNASSFSSSASSWLAFISIALPKLGNILAICRWQLLILFTYTLFQTYSKKCSQISERVLCVSCVQRKSFFQLLSPQWHAKYLQLWQLFYFQCIAKVYFTHRINTNFFVLFFPQVGLFNYWQNHLKFHQCRDIICLQADWESPSLSFWIHLF